MIDFLYERFPFYERQGKKAYKPGMINSLALDEYFNYPHTSYKTVHVAGTNGKGSTSSMLASVFQQNGFNVGLYTSPHLVEFGERVKVNGLQVPESYVLEFVSAHESFINTLTPSFFEVVTSLAFCYFRDQNVDVAIIEVGLGGRLDCTNVITPELSIVTNISYDHADLLGNTIPLIAGEKAGIIKPGVPVLIGESNALYNDVFIKKAQELAAPICFANELVTLAPAKAGTGVAAYEVNGGMFSGEVVEVDLLGACQIHNLATVLASVEKLSKMFTLDKQETRRGLRSVVANTGLMGRWQKLASMPDVFCDTGHNQAGIAILMQQVSKLKYRQKHIVWGMVSDKDASSIVTLLPRDASYYLTKPSVERAMPVDVLASYFDNAGLEYTVHASVPDAMENALQRAASNDLIIIGGSTFMVADAIFFEKNKAGLLRENEKTVPLPRN